VRVPAQDYLKDENGKTVHLKHCSAKLVGHPARAAQNMNTAAAGAGQGFVGMSGSLSHSLSKSAPNIPPALGVY
jgi:hypothetical protein